MSDLQKRATPGRPKGCTNYPPEFKQRLIEASFDPGVSISRLALDNGINANLLFKWRQQWRQGKVKLPSEYESMPPLLIPVTLESKPVPETPPAIQPAEHETLKITCKVTFLHGTLLLKGDISEKLLSTLMQELKL
ncbi:IS66-like element accessory protein TnpA [Enterobacter asburiae]|uniref:IS66-like element accessory protein TnpA n=1 Tax=Enterobacter asburiae TaxID=61645 RepID=UPI003EE539A6